MVKHFVIYTQETEIVGLIQDFFVTLDSHDFASSPEPWVSKRHEKESISPENSSPLGVFSGFNFLKYLRYLVLEDIVEIQGYSIIDAPDAKSFKGLAETTRKTQSWEPSKFDGIIQLTGLSGEKLPY